MRIILAAMRHWWLAILVVAGCSSSPSATFTLTDSSVDSTYWCPGGAANASYQIRATVHVHNGTTNAVTVESASAELVLKSVQGTWLEKVGDRYEAGNVDVTPNTIGAMSSQTLMALIPSACTSPAYGSSPSSSGSYEVRIALVTSAGRFAITARNRHEILAA